MTSASASSPSPLSITHIAAPDVVGGLERVVQGLAVGHHERGHDVHVISVIQPHESEHPFPEPLRRAGVPVHELHIPSKSFLRERREVARLLKELQPDVVHTHGYRPDLLHGSTARRLPAGSVTTAHGSSRLGGRTALYEWLQTKAFRSFDAVVAVSSPIARRLVDEGVPEERVHLIPNAWAGSVDFLSRQEARRRLGVTDAENVVAFVGRLIPAKGPDVFVDALIELKDPSVTGIMIGEGRQRSDIEATLAKADERPNLVLAGHLDAAAPLFQAFDLFVLSSRTEGTPIVLFEAMAAGVPTVVTKVGGVSDVVTDRESRLVPSEDPEALASAIRESLRNPSEARTRAERATERLAGKFGAARWLDRHEVLYRSVSSR